MKAIAAALDLKPGLLQNAVTVLYQSGDSFHVTSTDYKSAEEAKDVWRAMGFGDCRWHDYGAVWMSSTPVRCKVEIGEEPAIIELCYDDFDDASLSAICEQAMAVEIAAEVYAKSATKKRRERAENCAETVRKPREQEGNSLLYGVYALVAAVSLEFAEAAEIFARVA